MKRYRKYILFTMMFFCLLSVDTALAANNKVTVSVDNIIKQSEPLGYGKDWIRGYSFATGNTETTKASDAFIDGLNRADVEIPLLRMGGDSSNSFLWKTKLGTADERCGADYIKNEGYLDYYLNLVKVTDNIQFLVPINLNDTNENNMDLVRFLTLNPDDEQAIGSDGINWAKVRVDMGCPNPVPVYAFELGNELYPKEVVDASVVRDKAQAYTNKCAEIIPLLRAVNPDIKIAPLMHSMAMITYFDSNGKREKESASIWNQTVINTLKNDIDYVVHHDYFGAKNTSRNTLNNRDKYYDVIEDYISGTDIKIILSETGYYTSGVEMDSSYGKLPNSNVLGFAFGLGRFYIKAFSMPNVASVVHYGFVGAEQDGTDGSEWWQSYRYCADGEYRISAAGMIANLFAKASKGTPVKTKATMYGFETYSTVMSQAFLMPNGEINLILIPDTGKESSSMTVDAPITNYTPVTKTVVSGSSYSADNTTQTPFGVTERLEIQSGTAINIPAYSAVMVRYIPKGQSYVSDSMGEIKIKCDGNDVNVMGTLYSGVSIPNLSSMSLMILNGDADYQTAVQDDVAAVAQARLLGNKVYFKTQMPSDAKSGTYKAVIGYGNVIHEKTFDYIKSGIEDVQVECNDGIVSVNVKVGKDFNLDRIPVMAVYGENITSEMVEAKLHRIEYVGEIGNDHSLTFSMPSEALSGKYTLLVDTYSKTFDYIKADEKLRILNIPQNNDNEISNIADCDGLRFEAENLTDEKVIATAMAGYYKDGKLVGISKGASVQVEGNGKAQFELTGSSYDAELVKLFIWDEENLVPYIRSYYIK